MDSEISNRELTIQQKKNDDLNRNHPPLCIDCYHIAKNSLGQVEKHRCLAGQNYAGISLVDGEAILVEEYCIDQRKHKVNTCGVAGLWFKKYERPAVIAAVVQNPVVTKLELIRTRAKAKLTSTDLENL